MKNKITVIVPATSANCGPGYDSLGLACNLYNDFTFEILDSWVCFRGYWRRRRSIAGRWQKFSISVIFEGLE